ncbi:MAG: hypothetical protein WC289_06340 [Patescibacteria group bacterium]|jgi:hypothetical protein
MQADAQTILDQRVRRAKRKLLIGTIMIIILGTLLGAILMF